MAPIQCRRCGGTDVGKLKTPGLRERWAEDLDLKWSFRVAAKHDDSAYWIFCAPCHKKLWPLDNRARNGSSKPWSGDPPSACLAGSRFKLVVGDFWISAPPECLVAVPQQVVPAPPVIATPPVATCDEAKPAVAARRRRPCGVGWPCSCGLEVLGKSTCGCGAALQVQLECDYCRDVIAGELSGFTCLEHAVRSGARRRKLSQPACQCRAQGGSCDAFGTTRSCELFGAASCEACWAKLPPSDHPLYRAHCSTHRQVHLRGDAVVHTSFLCAGCYAHLRYVGSIYAMGLEGWVVAACSPPRCALLSLSRFRLKP